MSSIDQFKNITLEQWQKLYKPISNLIVQASGIPTSNDFLRNGVPLVIIAILFLVLAQTYYWDMASEVAGI